MPDSVQIREYQPADRDAIMALAPRLAEGKPQQPPVRSHQA